MDDSRIRPPAHTLERVLVLRRLLRLIVIRTLPILLALLLPAVASRLPAQIVEHRDVPYAIVAGRKLLVDLYLPRGATKPAPCIVWIHLGGWRSGSRKNAKADAAKLVADGFAVAAVEHRYSSVAKWPAQIHDCKGAVRWLRAHAARYNIDADRIGVFGHSSGGHLAVTLATSGGVAALEGTVGGNLAFSSRVQAAVDFSGPTDLLGPARYEPATSFASELIGTAIGELKRHRSDPRWLARIALARSVNPAIYASRDDPPLRLAHGNQDQVVPLSQSKLLRNALGAVGNDLTYIEVHYGHHIPGFEWDARRRWLKTKLAASVPFRVHGRGCAGAGQDRPSAGANGTPRRGGQFDFTLSGAAARVPAVALFGLRRLRLPVAGTDCLLLVDQIVLTLPTTTDRSGEARRAMRFPGWMPAGLTFWTQWLVFDPGANILGISLSDGARLLPK